MMKATKVVAAAAVVGVLAATAVFADTGFNVVHSRDIETLMPGHGVSLEIGGKHAMTYFVSENDACQLTVVLADVGGGESGLDSPGTRIVAPVLPGRVFKVDAGAGRSAEFSCAPGAARMSARVFDRQPYKS